MRNTGLTFAVVMLFASLSSAATPRDVSVVDPAGTPTVSVNAKVGDPVMVTLPLYPGDPKGWTYTSADGALGAAREEVVPRWLGPETRGQKFTFSTARAPGGDHVVSFKNGFAPPATVVLIIHLAN